MAGGKIKSNKKRKGYKKRKSYKKKSYKKKQTGGVIIDAVTDVIRGSEYKLTTAFNNLNGRLTPINYNPDATVQPIDNRTNLDLINSI
jgi:hypothetical protein